MEFCTSTHLLFLLVQEKTAFCVSNQLTHFISNRHLIPDENLTALPTQKGYGTFN